MKSSLDGSVPKKKLGHSPASAAPAPIAIGTMHRGSHQMVGTTNPQTSADPTAPPRHTASDHRKCFGLANGRSKAVRYSSRLALSRGARSWRRTEPSQRNTQGCMTCSKIQAQCPYHRDLCCCADVGQVFGEAPWLINDDDPMGSVRGSALRHVLIENAFRRRRLPIPTPTRSDA